MGREIVFVCSAVRKNNLVSKMIESDNIEDCCDIFELENGMKPEIVFGPFFKKKTGNLEKNRTVKFSAEKSKQGIYDGWHITAMPLLEPVDCAYLIFNKRADGEKNPKPNGMIVKINDIVGLK
jgi:hypothetical protein